MLENPRRVGRILKFVLAVVAPVVILIGIVAHIRVGGRDRPAREAPSSAWRTGDVPDEGVGRPPSPAGGPERRTAALNLEKRGRLMDAVAAHADACRLGEGESCVRARSLALSVKAFSERLPDRVRAAEAHFKANEPDKAVAVYDELLKSPGCEAKARPNLLNLRAVGHASAGRLHAALQDAEAALKLHPDFAPALLTRGGVLGRLGRREDGLRDYRKVCSLGVEAGCRLAGK